jgi:hypothetical protein
MEAVPYKFFWDEKKDDKGREIALLRGYKAGDPLLMVYESTIAWHANDMQLLEDLYRKFNIEHPVDYHGPSMSVGSVINLAGKWYACMPFGFESVEPPKEEQLVVYPSEEVIEE